MNSKYLDAAAQKITNPELLVNVVSRRVRQLAQGHKPLVETSPRMDFADIALQEIVAGKISFELVPKDVPADEQSPAL